PLWARAYAALVGSRLGVAWPVYGYAASNPLRYVDSNGLEFVGLTPSERAAIDSLEKTAIGGLVHDLDVDPDIQISLKDDKFDATPAGGHSFYRHRVPSKGCGGSG